MEIRKFGRVGFCDTPEIGMEGKSHCGGQAALISDDLSVDVHDCRLAP